MNKAYLLAPLAGLLVFGGYYWKHARLHEKRVVAIAQAEATARQQKEAQRAADHLAAMDQAKVTLAQRKAERDAKDRVEATQKQTRLDLEQRRNLAQDRARKLRPQLDRLRFEVEAVQATLHRLRETRRELEQEQAFLTTYVREVEANRQSYFTLLEKLQAAERSRAAVVVPATPNRKS
jgi:hypothetical protein